MKVLVITGSISRLAGGLFYSVRNLTLALIKKNVKLEIFSLIDSYTSADKNNWIPIKLNLNNSFGPREIGFSPMLLIKFLRSNGEIIHLHGIWMFTAYVTLKKVKKDKQKLVISPRGMLDEWATNNSHLKKKIIGKLYAFKNLKAASCIHALCESEYKSIRAFGLKNPVAIIPNGINLPSHHKHLKAPWSYGKKDRVILFLSRLHPKKNLENLINAFGEFIKNNSESYKLVIAGWGNNDYIKFLKNLVITNNLNCHVEFIGSIYEEKKEAALQNAYSFILPSFSEGLPMAVLEAWSYKLPTVITPECNLPEGFSNNAALKINTSQKSILEGLNKLSNMNKDDLKLISDNAYNLVKEKFTWEVISNNTKEMYKWILTADNEKPPNFIKLD